MIKKIKCNNCGFINFTDNIYFIKETKKWFCYDCVLNWDRDYIAEQIFQSGFWEANEDSNISMKENYINIPNIYIKKNYKTYYELNNKKI